MCCEMLGTMGYRVGYATLGRVANYITWLPTNRILSNHRVSKWEPITWLYIHAPIVPLIEEIPVPCLKMTEADGRFNFSHQLEAQ